MRVLVISVFLTCAATTQIVASQAFAAFGFRTSSVLTVPAFSDTEVDKLLATLDGLLKGDAADAVWQFARRLQLGQLSEAQESRVLGHLDRIASARPDGAAVVSGPRRMIERLTVGKVAPEISGLDVDGQPFKLSDYRGRVVMLAFTSEWCAICRTQIPYEQFLLDKYERWPFALLGVQTGTSVEAARTASKAARVPQRFWWDVPGPGQDSGPIASDWNVIGWPATYLIDGDGIIRFVDVRDEDLLKAVRQLLEAQADQPTSKR